MNQQERRQFLVSKELSIYFVLLPDNQNTKARPKPFRR
jgi:hypothetical protein